MVCAYCGIAGRAGQDRCPGCGAHRMSPQGGAAVAESATLYEQIGRAVVAREHGDALRTLARIGEHEEASERRNKTTRFAKIAVVLFLLWFAPGLLFGAFIFALMFFIWIYLPYRGVRAVLGWMTS